MERRHKQHQRKNIDLKKEKKLKNQKVLLILVKDSSAAYVVRSLSRSQAVICTKKQFIREELWIYNFRN